MGHRRVLVVAALVVSLVAGAAPYVGFLTLWPASSDGVEWVTKTATSDPGWLDWVFTEKHSGRCYRPVSGLSFALDHCVGGFAALPYRATDLGLHLASALLVYGLFRRLAPALSPWGGIVASAVFLAHPVGQLIVPSLSRRHYSLGTALGLGALLLLATPPPPRRSVVRAVSAALLMAAAVLSHELALTYVFAAGVVLGHRWLENRGLRRWAFRTGILTGAIVAVLLAIRSLVVSGVGGYPERERDVLEAGIGVWSTLAVWYPTERADLRALRIAIVAGAAVSYLWIAISEARGGTARRLPMLSVVWLLGFAAIAAGVGVWFPREAYMALAPLALLLGSGVAVSVRDFDARRVRCWVRLGPQAAWIGLLAFWSVHAMSANADRLEARRQADAVLRDLHARLVSHGRPAYVSLALPRFRQPVRVERRSAGRRPFASFRQPDSWMNAILRDLPITVESRIGYFTDPYDPSPPEVRGTAGTIEIVLPRGTAYFVDRSVTVAKGTGGREILRIGPVDDPRDQWIYFHDGTTGRLLPFRE